MLQFNELRITPDRKNLIVDVQVQDMPYYEDVYIDSVIITTSDKYVTGGLNPSNAIPDGYDESLHLKHLRKFYPIDGIADYLFFVDVVATGDATEDAPCGAVKSISGVVYDKYPLYQQTMQLLQQMQDCDPNTELKDFILQKKAFDIALDLGDYATAIDYWNKFFDKKKKSTVKTGCGCHGFFR